VKWGAGCRPTPVFSLGLSCKVALVLDYYLLEAAGLDVQLVNAREARNMPGRPKFFRLAILLYVNRPQGEGYLAGDLRTEPGYPADLGNYLGYC
jgi:hypothetical protein